MSFNVEHVFLKIGESHWFSGCFFLGGGGRGPMTS